MHGKYTEEENLIKIFSNEPDGTEKSMVFSATTASGTIAKTSVATLGVPAEAEGILYEYIETTKKIGTRLEGLSVSVSWKEGFKFGVQLSPKEEKVQKTIKKK